MNHVEYLVLLVACLAITLPLELVLKVGVYPQVKRLALTLSSVGVVFVAWDLAGAALGHWDYRPERVTGLRVLGLPVEEYLFFVVIPVNVALTFEAVRRTLPRVAAWVTARTGRR